MNQHDRIMSFVAIEGSAATWAYKKKCGSCNRFFNLVEKYTVNNFAKAYHLLRQDVYHTNANHAHEELRELFKVGQMLVYI